RILLPTWDHDGLVAELAAQVLQECDFRREAEHQEYFRERLADEPNIRVPAVISSHSGRRVLTSELCDGGPFYAFRDQASGAELDRAGELVTRLVIRTTVMEHWFNTDFHPGNLLFEGGDLWFLDFGNVRRLPPRLGEGLRALVLALADGDVERFLASFVQ